MLACVRPLKRRFGYHLLVPHAGHASLVTFGRGCMSSSSTTHKRPSLLPWIALILWVVFIWGHSFIAGPDSSAESHRFLELAYRVIYHFGWDSNPYVARLVADPNLAHFLVRKTAHFSEYFVLGILAFNAFRLTFSNPLLGALSLAALWVSVPSIDEYIQRFVPERSGQLSDVLLDMCGFASAFVLCLAFVGLVSIIRGKRE